MNIASPQELKNVLERLEKVVYIEPPGERKDGLRMLLDDARWLAAQLQAALVEIDRLTPKEAA